MAPGMFHMFTIILVINVGLAYTYMQACFFNSDSRLRHNEAAFSVKDIDFTLCTHYIYGYAKIDVERTTIMAADRNAEKDSQGLYGKFNFGKVHNPYVRTILSLSGDDETFAALQMRDPMFRYFPINVFVFLRGQGFDGLDINWEVKLGSNSKTILPKMLKALRTMFQTDRRTEKLLLTLTGCGKPAMIQANHDAELLEKYLDYIFVQSRDLVSENVASFIGPLYNNPKINAPFNVNESISFWKSAGVPAHKLVMGVTPLGHYIVLKSWRNYEPGSPALDRILSGSIYNIIRRMAYPEICMYNAQARKYYDDVQKMAYSTKWWEWVGYSDTTSLEEKIKYIKINGLAGIEFTNLDEDDFSGKMCNDGKFPLVTFIKKTLRTPGRTFSGLEESFKSDESNVNIGNLMLIHLSYLFLELFVV